LALKGIATYEEWDQIKEFVYYDFLEDNNFSELKDAELLNNRIMTLNAVTPYVGLYYSMQWVKKNVLHLSEEEIEEINAEIEAEQEMQMAIAAAEQAKQQVMTSTQIPQNLNTSGLPPPSSGAGQ
jgi:pantothenate kinase